MLSIPGSVRMYLCQDAIDLRKSFNMLPGVVRQKMNNDPLSGHMFVFYNRTKTLIKIIYWDHDGYAIWSKRLAQGTFRVPRDMTDAKALDLREFHAMLQGIVPKRYFKRYRRPKTPN
jgi:transposase